MSNTPHQNVQSLGASGMYGTYTTVGGAGSRSELDGLRMGVGRTPQAEYPDGYLGNVKSRRGDRLLDSLKNRQNERAYQRGVHKGERIDPSDYFWPQALQPERGLVNIKRGVRTNPAMELAPTPHLVNGGKSEVPNNVPGEINPVRSAQLRHLRSPWR